MRLTLFCSLITVAGLAFLFLPYSHTHAQSVFEEANASIETVLLSIAVNPLDSAFVSFGNGNIIQSLLSQPAIFPQENDKVSWGNANATIHSIPRDPFSGPPINFEELLAEKFKPILYLHQDEKYKPQEIQVVLDTADLYKNDDLVIPQPEPLTKEFLSTKTDNDYKLDLDGDTFIPGPESNPYKNTTYVHITEDQNHIVLQYWFFYYFNNWIGGPDHEGDWEFIQFIFEEGKTVQEIIDENLNPQQAVYSAHLGGYKSNWDSVEKQNDRPVVYVAKGSHANYFKKGTCDLTTPRGSGVDEARPQNDPLTIDISLPILDPILRNTAFEWLLFGGKWGGDTFSSPDSPLRQATIFTGERKWDMPIAWKQSRISGFPIVTDWNDFYHDHCDGDFDGIWNNVDKEDTLFSNEFEAPGVPLRPTKGTITERGDRKFKIKDAEVGGAHFEVTPGNEIAIIKLDGFFCIPQPTIIFKPSSERTLGIATCLSAEISLEEGGADFTASHNGIEVVATVGANQTVHYDIVDNKLYVETSGEGEIPLIINGKATTIQAGETFFVHEVQIDIKPGSDTNPINCASKEDGVIPIAILTTQEFDATTVDHTTVLFEGVAEAHAKRHAKDVDGDGDIDLMFHFRQNETTLTCESTEATLVGKTFSGDLFIGADSIDTKPQ